MQKNTNSLSSIVICQQTDLQSDFFFQKRSVRYTWNADKTFLFACLSAFLGLQTAHLRLYFLLKGETERRGRTFDISLFRTNQSSHSHDTYVLCMLWSSVLPVNCGTWPQSPTMFKYVPDDCVGRYSDTLRAGWSGDRIPVRAKFFAPIQAVPVSHPAVRAVPGLPGGKAAGAWLLPILKKEYKYTCSPPLGLQGLL